MEEQRSLQELLPQCTALWVLTLANNEIRDGGAERLAGGLPQCPALMELNLY